MASRARETASRKYRALIVRLAARVSSLRTERGLTQEGASEAAGLDIRSWQRIERAEVAQPTLLTLVKVASALRVEVHELLDPNLDRLNDP